MQNRIAIPFLLIGLFIFSFAEAQVKIGDNPQVIDPASILELESSDKVLVITRVDSLQMTTIVPNRGALVYNTTADCVFYYDGTQWINMCGATGTDSPLTADPIVNDISTIVITPTANGDNFEVAPNSINSEQIVNGGINGVDIQDGSIGQGKLQDNSVTQDKLSENSVGTFALDNDNVDLGDFTNNVGFITNVSIISGDANNAISPGTDNGGAFYDDSGLQTAIAANTTANAADNDQSITNEIQALSISGDQLTLTNGGNTITIPTANGSDTKINPTGANVTVTGTGTIADPYTINAADQADPSITNELTDLDFDIGTNILSLTNGATVPGSSVDLSSLAGGGGTTEEADGTTITGIGTNADPFKIEPGAADQILRTNAAGNAVGWVDFPTGTGGNQNLAAVLAEGTDGGAALIKNILNPVDPQDAATRAYVDAAVTAGGTLTDGSILIGGAGDAAQQLVVSGDAILDNTGLLTIQDNAINSDKILDDTVLLADLNANGATTDGEIMQWDTAANAGNGGWVVAPNAGHTGTANSIFFASADGTGVPITTETSPTPDDDGGLYWDPTARFGSGSLFVGLKPTSPTGPNQRSKVVIMEEVTAGNPGAGLALPLQIQNEFAPDGGGAGVGVLFSVEATSLFGKGALAYEREESWGRGDFHFLQNTGANANNPGLADKAFTIKNNGDIQLYAGLEASNGLGTPGQVLSSTGTDVEWISGGGTGADGSETIIDATASTVGVTGTGTTLDPYILTATAGDGSETVIDVTASTVGVTGTGTTLDPYILTATAGDGSETIIDASSSTVGVTGTGTTADPYILSSSLSVSLATFTGDGTPTFPIGIIPQGIFSDMLEDNAVTTGKILNATILAEDLANMGAANNEVLKWNGTAWAPAADAGGTVYTAGTGLTLSGANEFSVDSSTIIGDGNITSTSLVVGGDTNALLGNVTIEIGPNSVTQGQLAINSVDNAEIRTDAVRTGEILNATILAEDLADMGAANNEVLKWNGTAWAPAADVSGTAYTAGTGLTLTGGTDFAVDNLLGDITGPTSATVIADDAVTSAKIDDGTIEGIDMALESIDASIIETGAVETAEIFNETIINEDISPTAAIAGSKILPNFVLQIDAAAGMTSGADILMNGNTVVADYVFEKYFLGQSNLKEGYNFPSLEEIETFVKKYHHLPGIKSAEQTKKEGVWNLSKSNMQNLEKIEELYLHTINQEKEINKLKVEKETLSNELQTIKKDLEEIKSLLKK